MERKLLGSRLAVSKNMIAMSLLALVLSAGVTQRAHAAEICADQFSDSVASVKIPKISEKASDKKSSEKAAKETAKESTLKELRDNYDANNKKLAERYPKFAFAFKDPEAFVADMRSRFEKQKAITPEDPRQFDFPEAAESLKFIVEDLATFREELIKDLQKEKRTLSNRLSHAVFNERSKKVENITKALSFVNRLQGDITKMIESNKYPYIDTVNATYFYSRIRGYFQFAELNTYYTIAKYLDMVMHGYRKKSMDQELEMYKKAEGAIVQVRSGKIATEFRIAEVPFKNAFERKDYLEYVVIPSVHAMGESAFMHVLPHNIHIFGATNTPIAADGFNRPGGLFWSHDVRHEADRYMKVRGYVEAQKMTEEQWSTMKLYMHKWQSEFLELRKSIQDPDLQASVKHYHFYTHHDVGVPLTPSMFLNLHRNGLKVYYGFLIHKKFSKQGPGFNKWIENTNKAQEILENFWKERLPIERAILGHEPVKVGEWAKIFPEGAN